MIPTENKPRVYGQGRFDIRSLAQIASFLEKNNRRVRSRSDLLYEATETLSSILEKNGFPKPTEYGAAHEILEGLGIDFDTEVNREKLIKGLQVDSLFEFEGGPANEEEQDTNLEDAIAEAKRLLASMHSNEAHDPSEGGTR
jgi:hypothetical protein